jgi:hypothetical protein
MLPCGFVLLAVLSWGSYVAVFWLICFASGVNTLRLSQQETCFDYLTKVLGKGNSITSGRERVAVETRGEVGVCKTFRTGEQRDGTPLRNEAR